jgi:hypothetical protein
MKNLLVGALAPFLLLGCGRPAVVNEPVSQLEDPGIGADRITELPFGEGYKWTYLLESNASLQVLDYWYRGTELTNSEGESLQIEHTTEGQKVTEGTLDGSFEAPFTLLSYPLRVGRTWTSGSTQEPARYRFTVEADEQIETPAGRFGALKIRLQNNVTGERQVRWYAPAVGLVARTTYSESGAGQTHRLLRFQRPNSAD